MNFTVYAKCLSSYSTNNPKTVRLSKTQILCLFQLYQKLKTISPHLTVYKKEEIPDKWHHKGHRRVAPIIVVSDFGWMISTVRIVKQLSTATHKQTNFGWMISTVRIVIQLSTPTNKQTNTHTQTNRLWVDDLYCTYCNTTVNTNKQTNKQTHTHKQTDFGWMISTVRIVKQLSTATNKQTNKHTHTNKQTLGG